MIINNIYFQGSAAPAPNAQFFEQYAGMSSATSSGENAPSGGNPGGNPFYNQYNAGMAQYQNQMAQNAAAQNAQQWKFQVL